MSADPFNFGPPNESQSPPPGGGPPGGQGSPFAGPVPGNPMSAPSAGHPSSAQSANPGPAGTPGHVGQGHVGQAGSSGPPGSPFGGPAVTSASSAPLSSPGYSAQQGVFGDATAPGGELVAAKPPTWLLFLAAGLALAAGIIAVVVGDPVVAIVCWLLAGPVAIGLLALFVVKDTFARSSGLYAAPDWVKPMHYIAIGVCLLCILAPALRIADWVGHL